MAYTLFSLHLLNAWITSKLGKVVQFKTRDSGDAPKPVFVALCVFFTKTLLPVAIERSIRREVAFP
jgi:hypothetical protein